MKTELTPLQSRIRELYYKVQGQKTALANAEQGKYCTDGFFKYGNSTPAIDIRTVRHTDKIAEMLAFLLDKQRSNKEAGEILGLSGTSFTWQGATVENWTSDFKTRIAQINMVEQKANLARAESQLETFKGQDPEFFAAIELEKIDQLIG